MLKESIQLGIVNGEQRQTKKLVCWARRKQRRYILTRELYDYLIHRLSYISAGSHTADDIQTPIPAVDDLQTFRQALMMNGSHVVLLPRIIISPCPFLSLRKQSFRSRFELQLAALRNIATARELRSRTGSRPISTQTVLSLPGLVHQYECIRISQVETQSPHVMKKTEESLSLLSPRVL